MVTPIHTRLCAECDAASGGRRGGIAAIHGCTERPLAPAMGKKLRLHIAPPHGAPLGMRQLCRRQRACGPPLARGQQALSTSIVTVTSHTEDWSPLAS